MERVILVKNAASCCACGACLAVCPKQAITMETDIYGCQYPKIDAAACIQCGKCVKICGYTADIEGNQPQAAYAAVGSCDALVQNSASGGVFASLAQRCMEAGGVVAGAVLDCGSPVAVYHLLSGQKKDLHRMQGSKYVQSEAWRCYRQIIQALQEGKQVLFSGTPCQVMAVKRLTGDPENLITIDLVCHGVPPLQMLDQYVAILEKRFGRKITGLHFRDKSTGKAFCARIDVEKKKSIFQRSRELSFYQFFLEGAIYRENCYTCPYASLKRISDLTIGDYWGIQNFHAEDFSADRMPDRKDWSCILVNTQKGSRFLKENAQALCLYPTETAWVAAQNRQLNAPSQKAKNRESILACYATGGYSAVERAFIRASGGALRFYWRMIKNQYRMKKFIKKQSSRAYEN